MNFRMPIIFNTQQAHSILFWEVVHSIHQILKEYNKPKNEQITGVTYGVPDWQEKYFKQPVF